MLFAKFATSCRPVIKKIKKLVLPTLQGYLQVKYESGRIDPVVWESVAEDCSWKIAVKACSKGSGGRGKSPNGKGLQQSSQKKTSPLTAYPE